MWLEFWPSHWTESIQLMIFDVTLLNFFECCEGVCCELWAGICNELDMDHKNNEQLSKDLFNKWGSGIPPFETVNGDPSTVVICNNYACLQMQCKKFSTYLLKGPSQKRCDS